MWPSINASINGNGTCTSSEKSKSTDTPSRLDSDQNSSDPLSIAHLQLAMPHPPTGLSFPLPLASSKLGSKKESKQTIKREPLSRQTSTSNRSTESLSSEPERRPYKRKPVVGPGVKVPGVSSPRVSGSGLKGPGAIGPGVRGPGVKGSGMRGRGKRRGVGRRSMSGSVKSQKLRKWQHKCDYCEYTDYARSRILLHMVKHTGKPPYDCEICDYACYKKFELTDHMAEQHPAEYAKSITEKTEKAEKKKLAGSNTAADLPYVLPIPPVIDHPPTGGKQTRDLNESLIQGDMLYCSRCDYSTDKKWNMDRHVAALHPTSIRQKVYVCFVTKCRYRTIYKANFNVHLSTKHPGVDPNDVNSTQLKRTHKRFYLKSTTGKEPQVCTICCFTTQNASLFKLHLQRKHGVSEKSKPHNESKTDVAPTIAPKVVPPKQTPPYSSQEPGLEEEVTHSCGRPGCDFTARNRAILCYHMRRYHRGAPSAGVKRPRGVTPIVDAAALVPIEGVTDGRKYACPHCEFRTRKKYNLQVHLLKGHSGPPKPYKCPQCPYTCNLPGGVRTHCIKIHKRDAFAVPAPGIAAPHHLRRQRWPTSKTPKNKTSMFSGAPLEIFYCDQCSYQCRRKMWMTIHKRSHQKQGAATSETPNPSSPAQTTDPDNSSVISAGGAASQPPGVQMTKKASLHKRGLRKSTMSSQQYYGCDECGFRCKGKYSMEVHKRSHSMLEEETECGTAAAAAAADFSEKTTTTTTERPKFFCHLCKYWCFSQAWLTMHLRRQHQQGKPGKAATQHRNIKNVLKCEKCEYTTHIPAILKRHMLKHSGDNPYFCHLCDRKFAQQIDLTAHVKMHAA